MVASQTGLRSLPRSELVAGMRASSSLAVAGFPIGVLLGVSVREAAGVPDLAGFASSILIFAGSSQLAAVELIDQGAGIVAVVATVAMINARHLMYSAALSHRFRQAPSWFRVVGSYFLIDQVFALNNDQANPELATKPMADQMAYYLGTALPMCSLWLVGTAVGIALGDVIPASWEIDFGVPLMFAGLMVMSLVSRPAVVAAAVGGGVAYIGRGWPNGTGLLVGAVAGVVAAALVDRASGSERSAPMEEVES